MSLGRGRGRVMRRVSGLDHRLHPQQVGVHFAFRVRAEESGQRVSHRAGYRVIQELDLDLRGAVVIGPELYRPGAFDKRSRHSFPRDSSVRNILRYLRGPFDGQAHRPDDGPARAAGSSLANFTHISHEAREALASGEEFVDTLDWSVDVDRLLRHNRAIARPDSDQSPRLQVGQRARDKPESQYAQASSHTSSGAAE